jgi:hypothetical protein
MCKATAETVNSGVVIFSVPATEDEHVAQFDGKFIHRLLIFFGHR